ncbi:MAG: carbamate kinase, partial [Phycisphaerae bacterium]
VQRRLGIATVHICHNTEEAATLADLVEKGHHLAITHGNGPQIGNFLLRNEAAGDVIYPLPMEVAVAHVQGGMGYMIAQTLMNELSRRGRDSVITTIVTNVLVDQDDPSFRDPTKPIGRMLTKADADRLAREEDWTIKEITPGKYRRVVPSPLPKRIIEIENICRAVRAGDLIVTCGGGGIPVIHDPKEGLCGVRAVIDKDLASALLAAELNAGTMLILTNVDHVSINFGKPDEQPVERMTLDEAQRFLDEGQFPPGSMGPKIQSAINFLSTASDSARVVIGPLDRATDAVAGRIGTCITKC